MITPFIEPYRKRPGRRRPAPPIPLTLLAAAYQPQAWVRLTFDRPIDITALDVSQVVVDDGLHTAYLWRGTGVAWLIGPATVQIGLLAVDPFGVYEAVLIATASTGIAAVNDRGTWAGVESLVLPFP